MQKAPMAKVPIIAVVDDDEAVRLGLSSLIRSLGCVVRTFASGEDLLQSPHCGDISCIVSDIQMPDMSGLELHARLLAANTPIPTILITGYPDNEARKRALDAGVLCYLKKPLAYDELIACLQTVLNQRDA
jgi:FixJ family two-component response regulator